MRFRWYGVAALLLLAMDAGAQAWAPQKNVEIVAGSAPGGSNDKTARAMERILGAQKLVPTTLTVINRPGGGGSIAYTYVAQRAGSRGTREIAGASHAISVSRPEAVAATILDAVTATAARTAVTTG